MNRAQLSDLLRLRDLRSDRAQAVLVQARQAEDAARAHDTATQLRTEQAALARECVLADMGRQTGALRDIFHFAALCEDHEVMLDAEAADCLAATAAVQAQAQAARKQALLMRQSLRAQQKTTELVTNTRTAEARRARQALARREDDDARNNSCV